MSCMLLMPSSQQVFHFLQPASVIFFFALIFLTTFSYTGVASKHCKNFSCGKFYPFGRFGNGCGDPDLQLLDCDGEGGPYMRFNYNDGDGLSFPLKNLTTLGNANHKPAKVLLEITLNTMPDDYHSPLHQLKSGHFTYGSEYNFTVQGNNTVQYFFCDKDLIPSSAEACGFHWFPSLQHNRAQCGDSEVHTVTFPEAKLESPISDDPSNSTIPHISLPPYRLTVSILSLLTIVKSFPPNYLSPIISSIVPHFSLPSMDTPRHSKPIFMFIKKHDMPTQR